MFTVNELQLIAEACLTEKKFLESVEARGIPISQLIADVCALRAKAIEAANNQLKAELTMAKEKEKEDKKVE